MKTLPLVYFTALLAFGLRNLCGQGFVNLDFESTSITTVHFPGGDRYTATIPGWTWNTFNFVNGDPNSVGLNDIALDAPATTLHEFDSPFFPAIQGRFSVALQGGSTSGGMVYGTNGASIFQSGQVPLDSRTLIYSGGPSLEILFAGQMLTPIALSNAANYTVWGVDISAYAGQTGELRFRTPWQNSAYNDGNVLDDIRFSPTPVPEPSVPALCGVLVLCLFFIRRAMPA